MEATHLDAYGIDADQLCPNKGGTAIIAPCDQTWVADGMYEESEAASFLRRAVEVGPLDPEPNNVTDAGVEYAHLHQLVAWLSKTPLDI